MFTKKVLQRDHMQQQDKGVGNENTCKSWFQQTIVNEEAGIFVSHDFTDLPLFGTRQMTTFRAVSCPCSGRGVVKNGLTSHKVLWGSEMCIGTF